MSNSLVVLLLSVSVLLGAIYVNTVERRIIQIKNELLQHGIENIKVKEELKSTRKAYTQVKVELESKIKELKQEFKSTTKELKQELESTKKELRHELESTNKELNQELESTKYLLKKELESSKTELKQELESIRNEFKQQKVEIDSTREQIDVLRKDKDNARRKELEIIRADVNALLGKIQEIRTAPRTPQGCLSGVFGEHAWPEVKFPASGYISFNPSFTAVPALVYGLYLYDSETDRNDRLGTNVSNLSKSGFNIQISTWGDTTLWGARISWMACPKSTDI